MDVVSQAGNSEESQEEIRARTNWRTERTLRERDKYEEMGNEFAKEEERMIDLREFADWKLKVSMRDRMPRIEVAEKKDPKEVVEDGAILLWEEFRDHLRSALKLRRVPRSALMTMLRGGKMRDVSEEDRYPQRDNGIAWSQGPRMQLKDKERQRRTAEEVLENHKNPQGRRRNGEERYPIPAEPEAAAWSEYSEKRKEALRMKTTMDIDAEDVCDKQKENDVAERIRQLRQEVRDDSIQFRLSAKVKLKPHKMAPRRAGTYGDFRTAGNELRWNNLLEERDKEDKRGLELETIRAAEARRRGEVRETLKGFHENRAFRRVFTNVENVKEARILFAMARRGQNTEDAANQWLEKWNVLVHMAGRRQRLPTALLYCRDAYGRSLAQVAVLGKNDLLLKEAKSAINTRDKWGRTPIYYAIAKGSPETVSKLIDWKAKAEGLGDYGLSALEMAAQRAEQEMIHLATKGYTKAHSGE